MLLLLLLPFRVGVVVVLVTLLVGGGVDAVVSEVLHYV